MRRWFCVFVLLAGFSGQGYVWTVHPRTPAPIVRPVDPPTAPRGTRLAAGWWRRS